MPAILIVLSSDLRLIPLIDIWSAVSSLKEEQCHEYQRMEMVEQKQYQVGNVDGLLDKNMETIARALSS